MHKWSSLFYSLNVLIKSCNFYAVVIFNSLPMFRVVLSTAFSIISKTCFPAFPKMHVISFSRSLDHPPSTSMIKLSLVTLYPGHSLDNSSLSGPCLSSRVCPLNGSSFPPWVLSWLCGQQNACQLGFLELTYYYYYYYHY